MNSDEWILEWDKETSREFLLNTIIKNSINYDELKKEIFNFSNCNFNQDLNVIIPIKNRNKFLKKFITIFKNLKIPSGKKIKLIVVEQNNKRVNKKICEQNSIDYIFIKSSKIFNKCLCHNVGVFFSPKSENILFHDVDILMNENFFIDLYNNLNDKQNLSLQTFNNTLINLSKNDSFLILNEDLQISEINIEKSKIRNGPGGSILISRNTFFKIGGYDAELFQGWGYEDNFFWSKVDLVSKMETCNSPKIILFHLYHKKYWKKEINYSNNNSLIYDIWDKYFSNEDKSNTIYILNKKIKKYE